MIKRTQVIEFRNGKQVLSELHKLLVTITISMSFPEWLDHQAILWIHYKISPEIIKHYSISRIIELQISNENKSLLTAHCQLDSWKKNQSICKDVIFLSERPLLFYANGCFCNNLQVPIQKKKKTRVPLPWKRPNFKRRIWTWIEIIGIPLETVPKSSQVACNQRSHDNLTELWS